MKPSVGCYTKLLEIHLVSLSSLGVMSGASPAGSSVPGGTRDPSISVPGGLIEPGGCSV